MYVHHVPEVPVEDRKELKVCFTKQGKHTRNQKPRCHTKERKAQYPEEGKRQGVLDWMYHNEKGRQAARCI